MQSQCSIFGQSIKFCHFLIFYISLSFCSFLSLAWNLFYFFFRNFVYAVRNVWVLNLPDWGHRWTQFVCPAAMCVDHLQRRRLPNPPSRVGSALGAANVSCRPCNKTTNKQKISNFIIYRDSKVQCKSSAADMPSSIGGIWQKRQVYRHHNERKYTCGGHRMPPSTTTTQQHCNFT